ncbi:hypothetical protein AZF37_05370 [endosymbiont 'TC1' of Trimyema compressum]|uniref:CpXC domain-containing protein n=1 Tax=endosymbiont 'TC1' of Trimyema compressum TaxID=243899 RepID=UPI0007F073ED|nr:CpXC domain-containing protein [endosymbiont 'TC1' of Trimyema compressum]AMP20683.1 hypothetical protein AZF37_05370 [endosymbiont 'TC1' of Trimyema compressum]
MIQQIREKMNCPQCGTEREVILWEKVNVKMNPDLKEKLFDGTLNMLKCKDCGYGARIYIPLIYHDMDKKFFIHFAPDYPVGEEKTLIENLDKETATLFDDSYNNRLRVVFDYKSLLEKIRIFDEDLDDRTIEVCKLLARTQLKLKEGIAFYSETKNNELEFVFFEKEDTSARHSFSIPKAMCDEVLNLVKEKDQDEGKGFRVIDLTFAVSVASL